MGKTGVRGGITTTVALGVLLSGTLAGCGSDSESTGAGEDVDTSAAPADTPAPTVPFASTPYEYDGHGASVDSTMFGDDWPLTLKSGRVNCIRVVGSKYPMVVFTSDDNKRYSLNGIAKANARTWGYLSLDQIWAPDPATGAKKDISVLIDICSPMMP